MHSAAVRIALECITVLLEGGANKEAANWVRLSPTAQFVMMQGRRQQPSETAQKRNSPRLRPSAARRLGTARCTRPLGTGTPGASRRWSKLEWT